MSFNKASVYPNFTFTSKGACLFFSEDNRHELLVPSVKAVIQRLCLNQCSKILISHPREVQIEKEIIRLDKPDSRILQIYFGHFWYPALGLTIHINQSASGDLPLLPEIWQNVLRRLKAKECLRFAECHSTSYTIVHGLGWRNLKFSNPVSLQKLHILLCTHGKKILNLDLSSQLLYTNIEELLFFIKLLPSYCPRLIALNLSHNSFSEKIITPLLQTILLMPTLRYLNLRLTGIEDRHADQLAKTLARLTSLKYLSLAENFLGEEGISKIANQLNPSLTHLHLRANPFGKKGAIALSEKLSNIRKIKLLSLRNCPIGAEGMIAIAKALESSSSLTHVDFSQTVASDKGVEALGKALVHHKKLRSINLSGISFGKKGAIAFSDAFPYLPLEHLDISYCSLRGEVMEYFSKKFGFLTSLQTLDIQSSQLNERSGAALGKAFSLFSSLRSLNMKNNILLDNGTIRVIRGLRSHTNIRELILWNNAITSKGIAELAAALHKFPHLEKLDIGMNSIGVEGAKLLCPSFKYTRNLRMLNLSFNVITSDGAKVLSKVLPKLRKLIFLYLKENRIKDGIPFLAKSLIKLNSIRELDLSHNQSSDLKLIIRVLPFIRSLKTLNLKGNGVGLNASSLQTILKQLPYLTINWDPSDERN